MVNSLIVWYLFLAGAGSGAFLIASAVDALRRWLDDGRLAHLAPLVNGGRILGPAVVVLSATFLLADLGSPERALRVFFTASSSLLTIGSWSIALFCACSFGALGVRSLVETRATRTLGAALNVLAAIAACLVVAYSGVYLSTFPSVPFLHTPLVPLVFVASALSAGAGSLLLLGFVFQDREGTSAAIAGASRIDIVLLVLEGVLLAALVAEALARGGPVAASAEALTVGSQAGLFWLGAVVVGIVAPLALELFHLARPGSPAFAVGAACSLVGGLCLRYALLLATIRYSAIDLGSVTFWG